MKTPTNVKVTKKTNETVKFIDNKGKKTNSLKKKMMTKNNKKKKRLLNQTLTQ